MTLGEIVGGSRKGEINVASQTPLGGVAIIEAWKEVRRESNQESLTEEREVKHGQTSNTVISR